MNSKIQGIIVCGVCAACLGGVALFLSKTAPADKADSSSASQSSKAEKEPDESVVILSREASDIISVEVARTSKPSPPGKVPRLRGGKGVEGRAQQHAGM